MSMEHKAFIFDYDSFIKELAGILEDALLNSEPRNLITFIENNLQNLKHPDEGEPLDSSWREILETELITQNITTDISHYGDFAITKYYNPGNNIGIGYDWARLDDELVTELNVNISPLLGIEFGPENNYFDPGKMGSYFQSSDLVKRNLDLLNSLPLNMQENLPTIPILKKMLSDALALKQGLYITF